MIKSLESSQEFYQLTYLNHMWQRQLVSLVASQRMRRTAIVSATVTSFCRKGERVMVRLASVGPRIRLAANNLKIKALQLAWAREPAVQVSMVFRVGIE